MARTKYGRMITKDIENITIAEYIEYEAEKKRDPWGYAQSYTRSSGSTTLERKMSKRMTGQDKEEEDDALIDIFKKVADLGVVVNVVPKSLFEHLKLADLKETNMVVGMMDMTKKALLGIMENILLKIYKFLFHSDFVVIDMLEGLNETMLLGRPFLAAIHAQIDVFRREISLGIGEEKVKFDMNGGICHSRVPFEKIYMASSIQESKNFNPLEIEMMYSFMNPLRASYWSKEIFDVYDEEFDSEIEHLVNEYELKAGRKKYSLDEVWEKCEKFHDTTKLWYDKGFEEEEL
uniref:Uncharacterized protein n=1 Tax=Tanacetum cinerariifolium TaxID=118510 RepID=A0A6L2MP83_TANCI|nr:hypothetical protein [Tanacetum cinerariifolium]